MGNPILPGWGFSLTNARSISDLVGRNNTSDESIVEHTGVRNLLSRRSRNRRSAR